MIVVLLLSYLSGCGSVPPRAAPVAGPEQPWGCGVDCAHTVLSFIAVEFSVKASPFILLNEMVFIFSIMQPHWYKDIADVLELGSSVMTYVTANN